MDSLAKVLIVVNAEAKPSDKEDRKAVPTKENEYFFNNIMITEAIKDPITLHVDDVVIYTLRIYNEGEISGYLRI